jgi:hypothetical protein
MPYKDPEARKAYAAKHYKENKEKYKNGSRQYRKAMIATVNALKDNPCTDCKQSYPYYVMQFDHIADNKDGHIADLMRSKGLATVLAEIEKCELVCANCRAVRTHMRRLNPTG